MITTPADRLRPGAKDHAHEGSDVSPRVWRFIHNVVAHPLMEVLPEKLGTWLHDETARRAFIEQEGS